MGPRIDLLVISHSCLTAINRRPYALLTERGLSVEILMPEAFVLSSGVLKKPDAHRPGDPEFTALPLVGKHPRLWTYEGLWRHLERIRPRIVLIDGDPGGVLSAEVGAWRLARGAKVACISCDNMARTFGSEVSAGVRPLAKYIVAEVMGRTSTVLVDHVFAISPDVQGVMESRGFKGRASVMPLGFDPALFRPDPAVRDRERARLGLTEPTIAYFGRLSPEKGVHHLVEALGLLRDKPWQFLIDEPPAGSEYGQSILSRLEALGLRSRTVAFGATHDEMGDIMNAADIAVAPSASRPGWKEQYGRVVPEAMACGVPVITTRCGALPWLIGDAGVLAPEADPTGLAQVIAGLLDDPDERRRLGERAQVRAKELSLPRQVEVMAAVFERWLGR